MLNLNDLRLFVQAVDSGGFTAAARQARIPKSTVSKRIAELEAGLGVRLIHRTSRRFALTEVGNDFYDHARAALIEAEAAETVVRRRLAAPTGVVRITASVPTAQFQLADHLPALALAYPELQVQVHATDRFVDLVQEGFDIAVRSHFAPLPDSSLVQRHLTAEPVVAVASPDYLARRGAPVRPQELDGHDGLLAGPSASLWRLRSDDGTTVEASPRARLVADESLVLLRAAAAGLGIACLPESFGRAGVASGELVRLLPGWSAGTVTTTVLMPHRRGLLPSVRAVVGFLAERLGRS